MRGVELKRVLGFGKDGKVFLASNLNAIKVFYRLEPYGRERDCYLRLRDMNTIEIRGHKVPQLMRSDDELLIIEMTTVTRPFLLDFASVHLDYAPEFTADVMDQWELEKRDLFEENWPAVKSLLSTLETEYGIYLLDVHPGNISFKDILA
jgi:hypothetical protein